MALQTVIQRGMRSFDVNCQRAIINYGEESLDEIYEQTERVHGWSVDSYIHRL